MLKKGNYIAYEATKLIAELLKVNTTLNSIDLGCKVSPCFLCFSYKILWCLSGNLLNGYGMKYIADALKVNTSLTSVHFNRTYCLSH